MPNERQPKNPLPVNYAPTGGAAYRVKDGDTWITVARANGLDVQKLIYFNFHTNVPEEVNWYLRLNTGCNKPNGPNWTFSSSARPGLIYLYPRDMKFDAEEIRGNPGRKNQLARILDDHEEDFSNHGAHALAFWLDMGDLIWHGAVMLGEHAGWFAVLFEGTGAAVVLDVAAPIAFLTSGIMEIMNAEKDAVNSLRMRHFLSGLSEGVVLGANDAQPSYVKHNFWIQGPIPNDVYPEAGRLLQDAHNLGIAAGYGYGKELNLAEKGMLFHELNSRMNPNPEIQYGANYWQQWGDAARRRYYIEAAAVFRAAHLPQ